MLYFPFKFCMFLVSVDRLSSLLCPVSHSFVKKKKTQKTKTRNVIPYHEVIYLCLTDVLCLKRKC